MDFSGPYPRLLSLPFRHLVSQIELIKLFFVEPMYAIVVIGLNQRLSRIPFFWGVDGCYGVLIYSQYVSPIVYLEIRSYMPGRYDPVHHCLHLEENSKER